MEQTLAEALTAMVGAKLAAKVCAFLGLSLLVLGWLRSKSGRGIGRAIIALSEEEEAREDFRGLHERPQWAQVRDSIDAVHEAVQKVIWELGEVKRDLSRNEQAREHDHTRLGDVIVELTYVRARLEDVREHCEHCPAARS